MSRKEWAIVSVGEVITLHYGKALARSERSTAGSVPVYGANGVMDWSEHALTEGPSIIIGRKGSAGQLTRVDGPFWPSDVTYFTTHDQNALDFNFLHYTLQTLNLPSLARGVKPGINRNEVYDLSFSLPPLEEQQRIVAVLDEAFEGLARARAHAEANLQNARELFESFAKSVFKSNEASKNNPGSATVGAVCDIQSGAGFPLKYQGLTIGEHPFYKVSDMNLPGNEWELQEANHYISEEVRLELRARLFPEGSIVFPKVGGAIATNKKRVIKVAGCVDNNVMGLIPNKSKVISEYIHEWLRAFDIYEFSNKANPPSITQGTVSNWPVLVPSKDEQLRVVATAAALRRQTETLRKSYEARLKDLDDLRQSLLQKAFAGELI